VTAEILPQLSTVSLTMACRERVYEQSNRTVILYPGTPSQQSVPWGHCQPEIVSASLHFETVDEFFSQEFV